MKVIRKILLVLFLIPLVLLLVSLTWYSFVTRDVSLQKERLKTSANKIEVFDVFDRKIEDAVSVFSDQSFSVSNLSPKVKFAFIDTEDKRFYSHGGFDFRRIVKATLTNIRSRSFAQGASTISQQLIKNTHLTHEKTIKRKLQEVKLTRALEKSFSKDEILEKYLSTIYFGHNCFGISSASAFYFGKSPEDLTVADAAILAGLVKSPNNYSPFKNPTLCQSRKQTVLSAMKNQGHLTENEYAEALNAPLPTPREDYGAVSSYAHSLFDEWAEIVEENDVPLIGNIAIHTYYDPQTQAQLFNLAKDRTTDVSFLVCDHETAGISGFYSTIRESKRPTASLIKPLLVYAPALEEGTINLSTPILDEPTAFGDYRPQNYGGKHYGYVSAKEAFARSLNVPAVKILQGTGVEKSAKYLEKAGLSIPKNDYSLALALGGMKQGFSLRQLVSAYNVFPRQGEFTPLRTIQKIVIDGQTVYERKNASTRVFSKETAYLTTRFLQETTISGTAKKLGDLPFPVFAKTGTNGNKQGNFDAYTVAFTTKNTVGVWIGNADNTLISHTGGGKCAEIARSILSSLPAPSGDFPLPNGVKSYAIDRISYEKERRIVLADPLSPSAYTKEELFSEKYRPTTGSKRFSTPSIPEPTFTLEGNVFTLSLRDFPTYYRYKIERFDGKDSKVVYFGGYTETITDELREGESYVYRVTPYFLENEGLSVSLPTLSLERGSTVPIQPPPDIVDTPWWEE